MKRHFTFVVALLCTILCCHVWAQSPQFQEGKHYLRFPNGVLENDLIENFRKSEPGRVQVLEFFSYACSWCYRLDDAVQRWEKTKANYVSFHRVPVEFQPSWSPLTKAYYTAVSLNVFDKIHEPLFEAIHTDKIQSVSETALGDFFRTHGVSLKDFQDTFSSFEVGRQQRWAGGLSQAYRITSVPSIVIQGPNGAYITSMRMAESEENLFAIVNMLAEKENQS